MTFAWVAILMGLLYYGMANDASSIRGRLNMTFNILSFFCLMPYVSMSLYSADKKFYIAGEARGLASFRLRVFADQCATRVCSMGCKSSMDGCFRLKAGYA
jgi:hypothetical protein